MINESNVNASGCGIKCMSWTAVLVGALVGIGLSFLLNLFSLAIGLSAFSAMTPEGATPIAVGGFVGLVIIAFIAMFVPGWIAGYLGRPYCVKRNLGELYGFSTWCVALIFTIFLTAHVGQFLSQAGHMVNPRGTNVLFYSNPSEKAPIGTTTETKRANGTNGTNNVAVNTDKAAVAFSMAIFVTFFLFFIGAIAACFGGRLGMNYRKDASVNESCSIR